MDELLELSNETVPFKNDKPSLTAQIVLAIDNMDDSEKNEVLRKIKMQKAYKAAKGADKVLEGCDLLVDEREIAELVSVDRKKNFYGS